jgi:hypothetical protein
VHLLSGSGWLANTSTGTVSHVNGYSGQVDATVKAGVKAGDPFTVVQRGDGAYIVDQRTGAISRIDGASQTRGPFVDPAVGGPRVRVVVGHGHTYLVDRAKGVVQQVDPHSLQPHGPKTDLGGRIGDTVVGPHGILWAALPGTGQVAAVGPGQQRRTTAAGHRGDVVALAAPTGGVLAVDVTAGHAQAVSGSLPAAHFRPDRAAKHAHGTAAGHTAIAAAGHQVTILTGGSARQLALPCTAAQVVAHGRWAHVRCQDGGMQRIDLRAGNARSEPGPTGGADELVAGHGVPFANNAANSSAVAYVNGHSKHIDKYDAAQAKANHKAAKKKATARRTRRKLQTSRQQPGHPGRQQRGSGRHQGHPGQQQGHSGQRQHGDDQVRHTGHPSAANPATTGKPSASRNPEPTRTPAPPKSDQSTPAGPPAPDRPSGVATKAGDGSVTVSWHGQAATFVVVDVNSPRQRQQTVSGQATHATFSHLANGTKYCFEVQARNGSGKDERSSAWSEQACATPKSAGGGQPASGSCPPAPYPDVSTSSGFCSDIAWLKARHITIGFADGGFHPTAPTSRQAMAAFLYRLPHPGGADPTCTSAPYPDVSTSSEFCGDIAWLKAQHITRGSTGGGFHPTAPISRQAMAAFLYRLSHRGGADPTCTSAPYPDVPTSSGFCGDIAWLKAQHITHGYADGGFHPTAPVSRQAMAALLHRLAG